MNVRTHRPGRLPALGLLAAIALLGADARAQNWPPVPGTWRFAVKSVTTTATRLDSGSPREYFCVHNNGSATLYVGFDSAVTAATGWPVNPGETLPTHSSAGAQVYGIAASGTLDVRVLEVW
jgi:hypothetical protein